MRADDPRHGTDAGAVAHRREYGERPCAACLEGHRRANILRQLYPRKTPSIGTRRRIQALQAIGYSRARIAQALGYTDYGALTYMTRDTTTTILKVTAERVAAVYDELCMTIPDDPGARRARTWAKRHGYAKPLQWDDIDDPDETPAAAYQPRPDGANTGHEPHDEAAVLRILGGDWRLPCTAADKREVVARWTLRDPTQNSRGVHENEWDRPSYAYLERLTGWRADRYKAGAA